MLALSYQISLFRRNFRVYIETFKRDETAFQGKKNLKSVKLKPCLSLMLHSQTTGILFFNIFFRVAIVQRLI